MQEEFEIAQTQETIASINSTVVKQYLKDHPEFFEDNAQLLADIHLPSPHGSGTISLAERQQLAQRDKISVLESRFEELVTNAQINNITVNKIHQLNLSLHQAKNFDAIEQLISNDLPEMFELSDTCLKIWANPLTKSNHAHMVFSGISAEARAWINTLDRPYCGVPNENVGTDWFIEQPVTIAIIALRSLDLIGSPNLKGSPGLIGFLALASDDEKRFYPEMGTDFLTNIGELVSAALSRYVEGN